MASDVEATLLKFCREVDKLLNRRALDDGIPARWQISATRGEPVKVEKDLGDEEDIRSLVIDVRKFLMHKEPTRYEKVAQLLADRLTDSALLDANAHNRAQWDKAQRSSSGGVQVVVDGRAFTPAELFDLWAYGGVFHSHDDLVELWDRMDGPLQAIVGSNVNVFLRDVVGTVGATRNIIRAAMAAGTVDLD